MSATVYSTTTKTFHWLTALLIFAIAPLGMMGSNMPVTTDAEIAAATRIFSWHKTLGVAVFIVALARIAYALTQTKPAGLHPDRKAETLLAEVVHWLLYMSLVLVPLTGWIHHSAAAFGAPIWIPFAESLPFVPKDPTVSDLFGGLHWLWSKVMVVSILLHVAGALKHHVIDKDATLRRMWFGASGDTSGPADHHRLPAVIAAGIFVVSAGIANVTGLLSHDSTAAPALTAVASDWTVQDGTIDITITQLGSDVSGNFADWVSVIAFDETIEGVAGSVETTINVGSLSLGTVSSQAMGADFFDQTQFPNAVFAADLISTGDSYVAEGTLTIKGITLPVTMPFDLRLEGDTATMTGNLQLNRQDFAIGASMADESNLGFGVNVDIALTATR